jgi:hypothetical protein
MGLLPHRNPDDVNHEVFERVRVEHATLRQRLVEVRSILDDPNASFAAISAQLLGLFDELAIHFYNEECEGFFDEIIQQAPRLETERTRLCEEHVEMLDQTASMARVVGRPESAEGWREELRAQFERLCHELQEHERAEQRMLQQAYLEDIGSHD